MHSKLAEGTKSHNGIGSDNLTNRALIQSWEMLFLSEIGSQTQDQVNTDNVPVDHRGDKPDINDDYNNKYKEYN